jgi:hypothetical protein
MIKDEALRLALYALENIDRAMPFPVAKLAIKECRAALEAKDEPVATIDSIEQEIYENTRQFVSLDVMEWMLKRYYTTPSQQEAKDEPVAWMRTSGTGSPVVTEELLVEMPDMRWNFQLPLYTYPPQRTWVGLTDEEREQVINANTATGLWHMAKDIEAKLKEKNT